MAFELLLLFANRECTLDGEAAALQSPSRIKEAPILFMLVEHEGGLVVWNLKHAIAVTSKGCSNFSALHCNNSEIQA